MSVVLTSVIILFALIFLGFFLGKIRMIQKESIPDLSSLVINVTLPATVFCSIVAQQGNYNLAACGQMVVATVVLFGISIVIALLVVKVMRIPDREKGVWLYSASLSNNGFMGLPLALAVLGAEGSFLMAIGNAIFNLIIFSFGLKLLTWHYPIKNKISIRKMFVNNINIAVVVGLIFLLVNIPVPAVIDQLLTYLANITSGLSMLVVGLSLSRLAFKDVFSDRKMYFMPVLRLLLVPLVMVLFFRLVPINFSPLVKAVVILTAALPASSAQSMITEQYATNTASAGRAVFITTLFGVVTIPLMMFLVL